jgi:hypothetical protein
MPVALESQSVASKRSRASELVEPRGSGSNTALWLARLFLVCVTAGLAWYTWGHWGDFQIDNGRELYVPAEILKGKMLFRDLWYMYGPLAPYLKALLFKIFGVNLNVLYGFGLALAFANALLTFEVGRQLRLGIIGSLVAPLFFIVESFYPFIRNFIYPYSYAAALGTVLGVACLYFALRYAADAKPFSLASAALLAGLVCYTKQEIGFACVVLLVYLLGVRVLTTRSGSELARNLAICFAGFVPAIIGYAYFAIKLTPKFVFFDNWISTPGTYFMHTFGKITMPEQGMRFVPEELLNAALMALICVVAWSLYGRTISAAAKKFNLNPGISMAALIVLCLMPVIIASFVFLHTFPNGVVREPNLLSQIVTIPLTQIVLPKGIFFLAAAFTAYALWQSLKPTRTVIDIQEAALGIYATLLAMRQMMEITPSIYKCSVFFNVPLFLVFVLLICKVISWSARSLSKSQLNFALSGAMIGESVLLFVLFFPDPNILSAKFSSPYGGFYTRPDVATLFPQIIDFMKSHTQNNKDILVIPEPPSLYVFAGMDAPSRWYSLVPGYIAPDQEQQYIDELVSNNVRYVLIANRSFNEYQIRGFINDGYNQHIHHWIENHFIKVGQIGPTPDAPYPPYIVWIFERKDLVTPENPPQAAAISIPATSTSPKN